MAFSPLLNTTGYSGFWNHTGSDASPYKPKYYRSSHEYHAALALGKNGFRRLRSVAKTLNGAAPGSLASDSYKRVQAVASYADGQGGGGVRSLQTISSGINTATSHMNIINSRIYDRMSTPMTYPVDASGNGGGGKRNR